jgi:C4-dicarboxylate-specific signal transduction histidine kinase
MDLLTLLVLLLIIIGFLVINYLKLNNVMATQQELAAQMNQLGAQLTNISNESKATLQKVAELEAVIGNQDNVSPELQTAFDNLKAQVQTVDDLIPDATTPVEAPAETTGTDTTPIV